MSRLDVWYKRIFGKTPKEPELNKARKVLKSIHRGMGEDTYGFYENPVLEKTIAEQYVIAHTVPAPPEHDGQGYFYTTHKAPGDRVVIHEKTD
jgi:hypothetical protein